MRPCLSQLIVDVILSVKFFGDGLMYARRGGADSFRSHPTISRPKLSRLFFAVMMPSRRKITTAERLLLMGTLHALHERRKRTNMLRMKREAEQYETMYTHTKMG